MARPDHANPQMPRPAFRVTLSGVGESLTADALIAAVRDTVANLNDLRANLAGGGSKPLRIIVGKVQMSSPLEMLLVADEPDRIEEVRETINRYFDGLRKLELFAERPEGFSDEMLGRIRALHDPARSELESIAYRSDGRAITPSVAVSMHSAEVLAPHNFAHEEWTTIEGVLEWVQGAEGQPIKVLIREPLEHRAIECRIGGEAGMIKLLALQTGSVLRHRVNVSGKARYNEQGSVTSVEVDDFELFPDEETLPRFDELPPIDVTEGLSTAEYLRMIRNDSEER